MAATVKASQAGLQRIEQARRSKGWAKTEQAWYQLATTTAATLKRFWARKPIQQEAFVAICQAIGIEDWQSIADSLTSTNRSDSALLLLPGIYNESTWVERTGLMETLLPVLQSPCRVIVLTGMTGIGKTALAERLIFQLSTRPTSPEPPTSPPLDQYRRLNLDDGGVTADFASSGAALLRSLGEEPTLEDQKDARNLLNHLLQLLRTQPTRIQIDSLEKLLEGDDRQGWSEFCDPLWLDLLQQVLAGGECQSQIILTTQDVPGELEAIGSRYPRFWHCEPIRGLSEAEQLELFHKAGVCPDPIALPPPPSMLESINYLKRIGKLYEGHPLALRVIAEDLKTCGNDIKRYWQQCRFAELEANRPAQFSRRKLQLEVKQRVRDSLERLPDDAKHLLCRSAVYRRPVPESFWLAMLPERPKTQQQAALNLLQARSFAEEDWEPESWYGADAAIPLQQHNLIRSVAYELLKADPPTWETSERRAADQWLTVYQPAPDVPNLEKVRGQIEAFHHFCELEDWNEAKTILLDQDLGLRLQTWGSYREMIVLYSRLMGCLNASDDVACKRGLGNAYYLLSNYKQAISYWQQSLDLAREIGDRRGEGAALGNLGSVYDNLGNYRQAIEYYQQALLISREIGDRRGEGKALGNLGLAYYSLGNYQQEIDYHRQDLTIAREIGDRRGEGNALVNWGHTLIKLEQYSDALERLQPSLEIFRAIGDRGGEAETLLRLAELYQKTGSIDLAREYCDRALQMAIELGIPLVKECEELKQQLEEAQNVSNR